MTQRASHSKFISIDAWKPFPSVIHGFGTRLMGEKDLPVETKGTRLAHVFLRQMHSDIIHTISDMPPDVLCGDALLTDRPGFLLIVKTADCLPVLILSEKPNAVGAVHCGWRGTSLGLAAKAVRKMCSMYGGDPDLMRVALGPSIGPDCYEVGEDVKRIFSGVGNDTPFFIRSPSLANKYLFDLREANRLQLLSCGIRKENIQVLSGCTRCEEKFYSYRRDPSDCRRLLNFIGLLA